MRYKITITIDNLITNNLDKLSKTITRRNVELEVNTPIELDKKNILNYFARELKTYCRERESLGCSTFLTNAISLSFLEERTHGQKFATMKKLNICSGMGKVQQVKY